MNSDFDFASLGDIPDPFAADQVASASAANPPDILSHGAPSGEPKVALQIHAPYTLSALGPMAASPTRRATHTRRLAAVAAALAVESAIIMFLGLRPPAELQLSRVMFGVALPLLGATLALGVVSATLRTRKAAWVVGAVATSMFALSCVLASGPGSSSLRGIVVCGILTIVLSIIPIATAVWAMRFAFATAVTAKTVAVGAACGIVAAAFIRLHCDNDDNWHVLMGHGAAVAFAAALAGIVGTRITRS